MSWKKHEPQGREAGWAKLVLFEPYSSLIRAVPGYTVDVALPDNCPPPVFKPFLHFGKKLFTHKKQPDIATHGISTHKNPSICSMTQFTASASLIADRRVSRISKVICKVGGVPSIPGTFLERSEHPEHPEHLPTERRVRRPSVKGCLDAGSSLRLDYSNSAIFQSSPGSLHSAQDDPIKH